MDTTLILLILGAGAAIGLVAAALGGGGPRWWAAATAVVAASVAARLAGHSFARIGLADLGALAAVGLLLAEGGAARRAAAGRWLTALVPAFVAVALGWALIDFGHARPAAPWDRVVVGLFVLGVGLELALVPLMFWLPAVAGAASGVTLALVAAVIDVTAFADLLDLAAAAPWVFAEHRWAWGVPALLSLIGAAAWALAEREVKTIVAFVSVSGFGFLLLGLLASDATARDGVMLGLVGHAIATATAFAAIAVGERAAGGRLDIATTRGLAGRAPVASAVFMVAAGALVGLPPSLVADAHWRLFAAAAEIGGPAAIAVAFVAATLSFLALVRVVHRVWLGPSGDAIAAPWVAPRGAVIALVLLAVAIVVSGLAPGAFETGRPSAHVATVAKGSMP